MKITAIKFDVTQPYPHEKEAETAVCRELLDPTPSLIIFIKHFTVHDYNITRCEVCSCSVGLPPLMLVNSSHQPINRATLSAAMSELSKNNIYVHHIKENIVI